MLAPELRGKARLQLLSIIQEHNELIGRGDQNESKAQQIQNQKFFEQALKILLTGGEFNPEFQGSGFGRGSRDGYRKEATFEKTV